MLRTPNSFGLVIEKYTKNTVETLDNSQQVHFFFGLILKVTMCSNAALLPLNSSKFSFICFSKSSDHTNDSETKRKFIH